MDTLKVRDAKDVEQAVRAAIAGEQPLEIIGHGSRRLIGQPMATNALLDLSALNAVTSYEPNELIITVQAGAPLADVKSLIDSKNQHFAFEPVDTALLLGTAGEGTIGGMIGAGLAGPRRVQAGGARDHLLGAHAVSGFGDSFKAGGRVVKNVTGYDLCKLLAGSWGTLAVMTEVTLKVMPRPESERTLVLRGLDDITANRAMTAALGSPFDVSGAAHVPNSALRGSLGGLGDIGSPREAVTLVRLEGITASATHRAAALAKVLSPFGAAEILEDAASAAIWSSIRDVAPFAAKGALGGWQVWRIVCPPASGGALGQALARDTGGDVIYDWGGGLIWAALPPKPDAQAALVRPRVEAVGGHAMLLRASDEVRRNVEVFHPPKSRRCCPERARSLELRSERHPQSRPDDTGICGMKTEFSLAQLANPDIAEADKILRACVHCGFCTATCPTYVLLGDELDSPRGRIYLIREMLEKDRPPTKEVVKHIDRCLSCLACMTTCPSGVNYMHLVDQARVRIERDYTRPLPERLLRAVLAVVLPQPALFRAGMILARLGRPLIGLLPTPKAAPASPTLLRRIRAMLALAPNSLPAPGPAGGSVFPALGERRGRVALLQGCAQQVLAPRINQAAISLLTRHGIEVVLVKDEQCCGALTHHLGRDAAALAFARANIAAWLAEAERGGLDAILVTTSGCGTVIKDYGFMLREDRDFAAAAAKVSALAKDITEYLSGIDLQPARQGGDIVVAYHCGLFAAARTENHASPERIAFQERIRGERCTREPFVLRFGGDLQHSPA